MLCRKKEHYCDRIKNTSLLVSCFKASLQAKVTKSTLFLTAFGQRPICKSNFPLPHFIGYKQFPLHPVKSSLTKHFTYNLCLQIKKYENVVCKLYHIIENSKTVINNVNPDEVDLCCLQIYFQFFWALNVMLEIFENSIGRVFFLNQVLKN